MKITPILSAGLVAMALAACQAQDPHSAPPATAPAPAAAAPQTAPAEPAAMATIDARAVTEAPAMPVVNPQTKAAPVPDLKDKAADKAAEKAAKDAAKAAKDAAKAAPPADVKDATTAKPSKRLKPEPAPVVEEVPAPAAPAADSANGASLAKKCATCHNFNVSTKIGPGLGGVFGRKVGQMPSMQYSDSLKNGNWAWDESHLAAWICDSGAAVKSFTGDAAAKTKMPAQRVCDPAKQADLIAYLKSL